MTDEKIWLVRNPSQDNEHFNLGVFAWCNSVELSKDLEEKMSASLNEENPTLKRITQGFIDKTFPYQRDNEILEGLVRRKELFKLSERIAKAVLNDFFQKLKKTVE